ncbi:MAG: hypothetical protein A2365_00480 [Candidatus Nealsonbacteria bacterium RIFOXYB1_FULL_40_15]|uniref:phosphoribosylglycinamide formyltransferase 1 n=2 Tax=Candidatus Nealsoniibacteriota TaxID=1817911 RepID=A0A1G2ESP6_9BACT|nr:MAG: hypothetical protein A2365_00480 [Candidatus Nealsonbacteria bacterium RIFOXYB1_FULL_40_15]OGZ28747.1 MAG: hypothetical protein A2427_01660 [Candidatus Nealsonbacteria bacterium RIFOXYC1_FULL_40_7]OGZ29025.1 MAG: hypothetical protein A2562_00910 [Candidatus Nealsonbacteria bacterium RIFOXYD1_FULL_39_11]
MAKILILSSRKKNNYYLINKLSERFEICFVIYERQSFKKKLKILKNRAKKLGFLKVIGQLLFLLLDRIYLSRFSKAGAILGNPKKPGIPSKEIQDINSLESGKIIEKIAPDLVIVSGTGIIKENILKLSRVFLNIHCGITPKYRGVHGGFWAMSKKDFDNLGVTIHMVDKGIDTGKVIYQSRILPEKDFRAIEARQYVKGSELMSKAVDDFINNRLKPVESWTKESFLWHHPTILEYIKAWRNI